MIEHNCCHLLGKDLTYHFSGDLAITRCRELLDEVAQLCDLVTLLLDRGVLELDGLVRIGQVLQRFLEL